MNGDSLERDDVTTSESMNTLPSMIEGEMVEGGTNVDVKSAVVDEMKDSSEVPVIGSVGLVYPNSPFIYKESLLRIDRRNETSEFCTCVSHYNSNLAMADICGKISLTPSG